MNLHVVFGVLLSAFPIFATESILITKPGVRLRNADLNRLSDCATLPQNESYAVSGRQRLDGRNWWLKIRVDNELCKAEGWIPDFAAQTLLRKDENPSALVMRNYQFRSGRSQFNVVALVTVRAQNRRGVLEVVTDMPSGSVISLDPDSERGTMKYENSSGQVKTSNSGWISGVRIVSHGGFARAGDLRRWNQRSLFMSVTHLSDLRQSGGSSPPPTRGGDNGSTVVREMRSMAGHTSAPQRKQLQRSRGLYRFPLHQGSSTSGVCNSFHYNPDPGLVDAFVNKKVGWTFLGILQDWNRQCGSSRRGCRVAWGDISHQTKLKWNGHKTHTHGHCIDMRPLRRGSFRNAPLQWQSGDYDRAQTEKLIRLLRRKGANRVLFNDPQMIKKGLSRKSKGHDNHIHVCFNNTGRIRGISKGLRISRSECSYLTRGRVW